jgi:hypothetical protein
MIKLPLIAALLATSAAFSPALSWYQGALRSRDLMVDAALVFAYYEKCNAGPMPTDIKGRAEEKLNMAGPSAAAGAKADVKALIKKLGVKQFCDEYRHEVATEQNHILTGRERPSPVVGHPGQTGNDWAADCQVSEKTDPVGFTSCRRYVRGVADGLIIAQMLDEAAGENRQTSIICISKLATTDQLVEIGMRYLNRAKPETRNLRAAQFLAEAWRETWPCHR